MFDAFRIAQVVEENVGFFFSDPDGNGCALQQISARGWAVEAPRAFGYLLSMTSGGPPPIEWMRMAPRLRFSQPGVENDAAAPTLL